MAETPGMYFARTLEQRWPEASGQFRVLLLTGPRQAGKTTLLEHLCGPERTYVTLDDPTSRALANDDPRLFLERFPPPLLLDEIQYAPGLLPYIKMAVDSDAAPGAFWLTGSQQFALMKGVSESLAGRVGIVNLLGFSGRERHRRRLDAEPFLPSGPLLAARQETAVRSDAAEVFRDIWLGAFPGLVAGPVKDRDLFYSSYLQTYLQRDVRDLTHVASESAFLRFLKATAARTGQLLNVTELARDVDVSVNTAKSWLSVLEASFQVFLLPPYHTNLTKRLVKTPKLYFLDTGLCAYLTEWSSPETLAAGAMAGPMLETYVLAELLKSWWHRMQSPQIYHYRDKDGREIDFLLVRDGTLHPLEVKRSATPQRSWVGTMASLKKRQLPVGEGGVVCLCPEYLPLAEGVYAVPVGLI
jgi:hypothetical protein